MKFIGSKTLISGVLSLLLHLLLGGLLIFSFDLPRKSPPARPIEDINIVKAVAIDKRQVDAELEAIKKFEEQKREQEQKRLNKLAQEAKALKGKRETEEKKLVAIKRKKQQEEAMLKEEKKKLAALERRKQQEETRLKDVEKKVADTEKRQQQEQDRLRQDQENIAKLAQETEQLEKRRELENQRIKEAEKKAKELEAKEQQRLAEERRQEEAKKKKQFEQDLAAELAAEETAEQRSRDQQLINGIKPRIIQSIEQNFNLAGLPDGLESKLLIRLIPSGAVISVSIEQSSGNEVFDSRAVNATQKASPLPISVDAETFERLGLREINIIFKPTN